MGSKSVLELVFRTSKQGQGGKQAAQELKNLKDTVGEVSSSFLGFNAASFTAVGAVAALAGTAKQAIDNYRSYGESIRGLAAISGAGAEDISRLQQTFDNLGISQEKFQTLVQGSAKKGFVMTVDNVAKLADEYMRLGTVEEQNKLLLDKLGKSGLDVAKAFQSGGDAIRGMAEAQMQGMIITDAQIAQLEVLRQQEDNLLDIVTAVGNSFAMFAIPMFLDYANAITEIGTSGDITKMQLGQLFLEMLDQKAMREAKEAAIGAKEGIAGYSGELENNVSPSILAAMEAQAKLNTKLSDAVIEAGKMRSGVVDAVNAVKDAEESWMKGAGGDMASALEQAGLKGTEYRDALSMVDEVMGTSLGLQEDYKNDVGDLAKNYSDGKLSAEEFKQKLGEMKEEYMPLNEQVQEANDKLWLMQLKWQWFQKNNQLDLEVNIHQNGNLPGGSGGGSTPGPNAGGGGPGTGAPGEAIGEANGTGGWVKVPPGYPGDSFPVWMSSGEQYQVKNDRERWTEDEAGKGAAVTIQNVNINNGMDLQQFEQFLVQTQRKARRG
jgi:hypothetical protein